MALNEIAQHFYEKEVERLLGLDDVKIIKDKFLDMRSQIDDLHVELGDRARRIAELESELETAEKAFNHIRDCSKRQFDKNKKLEKESKFFRDEAQKQSWRVSELDRAVCVKTDLLKKANEKIAELETELSVKEDLLKIKNGLCNEKSVIEILKNTPFVEDALEEEPLPFSDEQYEEETKVELPTMPIDVASMLINATVKYPTPSICKVFGAGDTSFADKYSKNDLKEIAEHLLVFCNNPDDDEDDTQS